MIHRSALLKNRYFDSVFLMRVAKRLGAQPGIAQAALVMGTPKNIQILAEAGYPAVDALEASPNDLVVSLKAASAEQAQTLLDSIDRWLTRDASRPAGVAVRTLDQALTQQPASNVASISVPGEYAAREAKRALQRGLNVFLFSDHVSVEEELALKQLAGEKGLLMMGPDCGTSIIGGVGMGFANAVRNGPIGVIGASGTGTQEVTSLIHRRGSGISHAIGVGSRDLTDAIGGLSALQAMDALDADPGTSVILLVSKPPGARTVLAINQRIAACTKPVVTCYFGAQDGGGPGGRKPAAENATVTRYLDEAANAAIELAGGSPHDAGPISQDMVQQERANLRASQKFVRGVFAGGTLCYQAQQVLRDASLAVHSNEPLDESMSLADVAHSIGHTLVDMGADEFTEGKPHPMIDSAQRVQRIMSEAGDPRVAVLLLDCILGYVAAEDPAGDIAPAIRTAKDVASERGDHLIVVCSVCGVEDDRQGLAGQVDALKDAGAIVFTSGLQAARFASQVVSDRD
jgi:succinyl-CoA synthetase alpha subunit